MSGDRLLTELQMAGVRIGCTGAELYADVLPGSDIGPYAERIKAMKPALLAALDLRARIIAAVLVEPEDFDRDEYDRLWEQWHEENPS